MSCGGAGLQTLMAWAALEGMGAIGVIPASEFPAYLKAIAEREEYSRFDYRPHQQFVNAGLVATELPTLIVLATDYFHDSDYGRTGYKLSNYSRHCWSTVEARTGRLMRQLADHGYRAERVDLPERAAACRAGLGFIGRNCMFYAHGFGSYVGLSTIATDMVIPGINAGEEQVTSPDCQGCRRCIDACPTQAIAQDGYRINPYRCLSFINRHPDEPHRETPSRPSTARRWLHGCEICQDVCPLNRSIKHRRLPIHQPEIDLHGLRVPNQGTVPAAKLAEGVDKVSSPGYRAYIGWLLADEGASVCE